MKHTIAQGLGEYSPSFCLFGTAFWVAWITTIYSGDVIIVPVGDAYVTSSIDFIFSTAALGLTLVLFAMFNRRVRPLLASKPFMLAIGILAALSTLGVCFAGALPTVVFYLASALTGVATGFLCTRSIALYAEVDTKYSVISSCASLILGVLIYALFTMAGFYFVQLAVAAATSLLPLLGILVSFVPAGHAPSPEDHANSALNKSFWKITTLVFVVVFGFSAVRGMYPKLMDVADFSSSRGQVAIALIAMATVVAFLAARKPRNGSFTGLFYGMLAVAVAGVIPMLVLGADSSFTGVISSIANGLLCLTAWNFLASTSYSSGMSPVRVFGFGYGILALGMTLGFVVGDSLGSLVGADFLDALSIGCTVVYLVAGLVFLRESDLAACMAPTGTMLESLGDSAAPHEASAPEAATAPEAAAAAEVASAPETAVRPAASKRGSLAEKRAARAAAPAPAPTQVPEATASKGGKFTQKCRAIADAYGLSSREAEVFLQLAKGKEAQAIADDLFVSFNTARTHIRKIYGKLGVHSRRELLDFIDSYQL